MGRTKLILTAVAILLNTWCVNLYAQTIGDSLSLAASQPYTIYDIEADEDKCDCCPYYLALRTNLLYNALLVPNLGVECYMGGNVSVAFSWMHAWWKTDRKHYYWRTYGGELEIRKWFGTNAAKRLNGHHIGAYAGLLTYDFALGGRGYLATRWTRTYGLSYGYSMPIGKYLNLDCSIGMGYLGGRYKEYLPQDDCYVWQATKNRRWVGPTKAEVTLVWLFMEKVRHRKYQGSRW